LAGDFEAVSAPGSWGGTRPRVVVVDGVANSYGVRDPLRDEVVGVNSRCAVSSAEVVLGRYDPRHRSFPFYSGRSLGVSPDSVTEAD
jgi:hypothetical protein